jgi:hypothetical protein
VALGILLTPPYLHAAHDAAGSADWLGYTRAETRAISDRTVGELVFGPATFAMAAPDGSAFYQAAEAAHLRDARAVLYGFVALAVITASFAVFAVRRARHDMGAWRAVARGGGLLAASLTVVGLLFAFTFDVMFELFHRIFFPGGNWSFDPGTQRLVQLYPIPFWQITVGSLAVLAIGGGALVWWLARRRARAVATAPAAAAAGSPGTR